MNDILDYFYQAVSDSMRTFTGNIAGNKPILYNSSIHENQENVFVLVRNITTTFDEYNGWQDDLFSVLVQAQHDRDARKICLHILTKLNTLHNIELRAPEFGDYGSDPLKVSLMKPDGPVQIGDVGMGRFQYSIQYSLKTSLSCED